MTNDIKRKLERKGLCDCLDNKDKDDILVNLDENIRHDEYEIINLQRRKEEMIISGDINFPEIQHLEDLSRLRQDKIDEIKKLISKIENTKSCNDT